MWQYRILKKIGITFDRHSSITTKKLNLKNARKKILRTPYGAYGAVPYRNVGAI